MSVSEKVRSLAREGLSVTKIAKELGIRYQHAYNVLSGSGILPKAAQSNEAHAVSPAATKPTLTAEQLVAGGFQLSGRLVLSTSGDLIIEGSLPNTIGVYAFGKNGVICYVGAATTGLAKRIYFYRKPGPTQLTNIRLNRIIKDELLASPFVEIYTAAPSDLEWSGLPVNGSAGLEFGLIRKYALPWNILSAG